jgi:lipopolysaccharide/colanic/teichoic acid biosynthesis glycosyltransferase/VanZ family protein
MSPARRFLKYWLLPILWMAFFFPVGNRALSSSMIYKISTDAFLWLFPHASQGAVDIFYVVFRKSLHFLEYGVLAFLLYRAFRGADARRWNLGWALKAGLFSVAYGFLDEYLQSFVPRRNGSPIDWGVDTAGIAAVLGTKFLRRNSARPGRLGRALFLKRPFDITLSFVGLVLSSPLWLLFGLLIWLQDRGPIFYGQERVGKNGRIFKALKFRSMIADAEKGTGAVQAVANDPRVTKVGRILRATAMDELPQLWNIFKGDMSFVGPRALRPHEKEVHGDPDTRAIEDIPGYHQRHGVRPGLTGLTQVYLPGETPRRKKFRYDLVYISKRSFWLDLKLIVLSFWITFRGKWESRSAKV